MHPYYESAKELLSRRYGFAIEALPSLLDEASRDASIQLCGSISEGLGNDNSDVDLLVIGAQAPETNWGGSASFGAEGLLFNGEMELNVTFWNIDRMKSTCARARRAIEKLLDPSARQFETLGNDDLIRLHRLRSGIDLTMSEQLSDWRKEARLDSLYVFHVFTNMMHYAASRDDAVAQDVASNRVPAAHMLRLACESLARTMLGAAKETNNYRKWIPTLLLRHREVIGARLVDDTLRLLELSSDASFPEALQALDDLAGRTVGVIVERCPEISEIFLASAQRTPLRRHGTR